MTKKPDANDRELLRRLYGVVTCAFCGTVYPPGTPDRCDRLLVDHIRVCEEHPMRELEAALTASRAETAALQSTVNDLRRARIGDSEIIGRWMSETAALRAQVERVTNKLTMLREKAGFHPAETRYADGYNAALRQTVEAIEHALNPPTVQLVSTVQDAVLAPKE